MSENQIEVPIKNLEELLQKCLDCKNLELIKYTTKKLLPAGENYCSLIIKLDATIRRSKGAKEETMYMVAKAVNDINTVNSFIDWDNFFRREVFFYAELLPAYQSIEREMGIESVIDIAPKFIGYRCSLNDSDDVVDENSIFLMENLNSRDFYMRDRKNGADLIHAKKVLANIARYHALGMALKQKRPELFAKTVDRSKKIGFNYEQIDMGYKNLIEVFRENSFFDKYMPLLEKSINDNMNGKMWTKTSSELWISVTHGDLWINNILFHKDKQGNLDDIKFIDFQLFLCNNPLKDLPYFLLGSLDQNTKSNHMNEIIDVYYKSFVYWLERLGCDVTPFTKEFFDEELKNQMIRELAYVCLAVKVFCYEVEEEEEEKGEFNANVVLQKKSSNMFIEKLKQIIEVYENMGWI